jgi:hypothetical protein
MSWHPIARKQLKGNPVVTIEWGGNGSVQPVHGDCPLLPFTRYGSEGMILFHDSVCCPSKPPKTQHMQKLPVNFLIGFLKF